MRTIRIILCTVVVSLGVATAAAFAFLQSGFYDIAAARPHLQLTQALLTRLKRNAVAFHARDLQAPDLRKPELIARGFRLYEKHCLNCHGAPGVAPEQMGIGLNPTPPPLLRASYLWKAEEIAWITEHGLKMAGMPAFAHGAEPLEIWAITAFVCQLDSLNPRQYQELRAQPSSAAERWQEADQGWERLVRQGNSAKGKRLATAYGCLACHQIGEDAPRTAAVGPSLANWAERHFIAGTLINSPRTLVRWIRAPQELVPGTAMPALGVSERDAWHIAAYLYSLGAQRRPHC